LAAFALVLLAVGMERAQPALLLHEVDLAVGLRDRHLFRGFEDGLHVFPPVAVGALAVAAATHAAVPAAEASAAEASSPSTAAPPPPPPAPAPAAAPAAEAAVAASRVPHLLPRVFALRGVEVPAASEPAGGRRRGGGRRRRAGGRPALYGVRRGCRLLARR